MGDALGTDPPDPHGHRNGSQSAFFSIGDLMSCNIVAKRPCYGQLKINMSYIIVLY